LKSKVFSVIKYIFFLSLGLLLFWLAIRGLDLTLIFYEIRNANYFWIFLSFIPAIISYFSRAVRWNVLLQSLGHQTNTYTTTYAVIIGYFANYAVPRIGEITRCGILSRKSNIPFNTLIGTVIVERIFDMICLLIITLLVVIFQFDFLGNFMHDKILEPLMNKMNDNSQLIIIIGILCLIFFIGSFVIFYKYSAKLMKYKLFAKIHQQLKGFWDGMKSIRKIKNKKAFYFQTFILWLMYFFMIYIAFFAIEGTSGLNTVSALTILVIGTFGFVAPVPGGIGAYHWIVITTLVELYNVANEQAASFAVIVHASQALLIIFIGVISFLILFLLKKRQKHAVS